MNYKYKQFCKSTEKRDALLGKMKRSSDRSGVDGGSKHFVFYPIFFLGHSIETLLSNLCRMITVNIFPYKVASALTCMC